MATPNRLRTVFLVAVTAPALFGAGWFAARRTGQAVPPAPPPAVEAAPEAAPVADGKAASGVPGRVPGAAGALLASLEPAGGLKNQVAILNYASSLDLAGARALAKSFDGLGWSLDANSSQMRAAALARWAELDAGGILNSARLSGDRYFKYAGMSAGFDVLARRDPARAWEIASGMGPMKADAQRTMLSSLAAVDPAGAFKMASGLKGAYSSWALSNVAAVWAQKDPDGAAAAIGGLPRGMARTRAVESIMGTWAVTDYEAAAAWAVSQPDPQDRVAALSSALNSIAQSDPERSLALLDAADVGNNRQNIINTAVGSIALRDFDAAMGVANTFTNYMDKAGALGALSSMAGEENRDKLLALAKTLPLNLARSIYQGDMWREIYTDPDGAMAKLEAIPVKSIQQQAMVQAVGNLAYYQPDGAVEMFAKLQTVSQTPELASGIANGLAQGDPAKAVEWANQLGTEAMKKAALVSALQNWAGSDPARAGEEIGRITNPDTRAEVTRAVAESLAGRSLQEAERWAQTLSGDDRSSALGKVVENAATQAPDRVQALYAQFVSALSPQAAARSENQAIARTVASQLAQTDATSAAAWAQALPEGGARNEAVAGVVSTWAGYDAVAASEWLHGLPAGDGRDLAAGNLVATIARDDPESAWAWATSINDAARRRAAAASALAGWKANGSRDAAQAALEAGGFSGEEYKELARSLE